MPHIKDVYHCGESREYEYKFIGRWGESGAKRAARRKATPEQIRTQNQRNREKTMRRTIKLNFNEDDIWATLKYPRGTRKPIAEVKADIKKFFEGMRYDYGKHKTPLKFIYRMEIGARGGIHIHLLVNRIRGTDTDRIIQNRWKHGRVNYEYLYEQGGYKDLAEYIVKQPTEEIEGQLSMFNDKERKELLRVSTSRNLVRPHPERTVYTRNTVRRLILYGPRPTPGYYIDKESIVFGTNPYTGMSYYYYTENKIRKETKTERAGSKDIHTDRDKECKTGRRSGGLPS